jgi:hypothetical protein
MEIDSKYKIRLCGTYWAGINTCPKCGFQPDTVTTEIIGFANSNNGIMTVCECPKCFKKWYFHARDLEHGQYYYFKMYIENGWQRHFKSEGAPEVIPTIISPLRCK